MLLADNWRKKNSIEPGATEMSLLLLYTKLQPSTLLGILPVQVKIQSNCTTQHTCGGSWCRVYTESPAPDCCSPGNPVWWTCPSSCPGPQQTQSVTTTAVLMRHLPTQFSHCLGPPQTQSVTTTAALMRHLPTLFSHCPGSPQIQSVTTTAALMRGLPTQFSLTPGLLWQNSVDTPPRKLNYNGSMGPCV